jgi:DnaJ-class molecular chaperone
MTSKTYYDILGVCKDSDAKDIKKAYRTLSLKYHPDRNSDPDATETYKQINEAYEILGDSDKKQEYDNGNNGNNGNINHFNQNFTDVNDIFNMMFSGQGFQNMQGHPNIRMFSTSHGPGRQFQQFHRIARPHDIDITIIIDMKQSFSGCIIPKEIERFVVTNNVKITENETIYINIPEGIDHNEAFIIKDKGHIIDNVKSDLKVIISVTDNVKFKRIGLDLIYKQNISLKESLCGFRIEFEHISGKKLNLNNIQPVYTIIKPGYKKIIPGYGMKRDNVIGNLIFDFDIVFPDSFTSEQVDAIELLLP